MRVEEPFWIQIDDRRKSYLGAIEGHVDSYLREFGDPIVAVIFL
jgi:hypothetical protein